MSPRQVAAQGGKAAGLIRLAAIAPVPRFVVLDAEWIAGTSDLQHGVLGLVTENQIAEPFAVRSSAALEDGLQDSFAGLYATLLGVGRSGLGAAVREVCASADSERVREYKDARGIASGESVINVIVQEMVAARAAGVAFSKDPTNGDTVVLEAVRGVGEELVSGAARPDLYRVDRATMRLLDQRRGRQFSETLADGTRRRLSGRETVEPRLSENDAVSIAQSVVSFESAFSEATNGVDVEWAIDAQGPKFLQCRAITTQAASSVTDGGEDHA